MAQHEALAPTQRFSRGRVAKLLAWSTRPDGAIAVAVGLMLVGAALAAVPALRNLDLALLDVKFALLATHAPLAAPDSIAVVGIDEPSLDAIAEPQSLLLRPLASALNAIVGAKPRPIGLDIVLPDRSYDAFAPGSDRAMVGALLAARREVPIIAGITTRDDGSVSRDRARAARRRRRQRPRVASRRPGRPRASLRRTARRRRPPRPHIGG